MKILKKLSSLFLSFLVLFSVSSCSSKNQTFFVEHSLKGELVSMNLEEFKTNVKEKEHMVVFINTETCSACQQLKEEFLLDFIKDTKIKIYSYELNQDKEKEGEFIKSIVPEDAKYVTECYEEDKSSYTCFYVPIMLIIENGQTIHDALGTKAISRSFFDKYVVTSNVKNYVVKPHERLKLNKVDEASFIPYSEEVKEGIIYHTNDKNNEEIKYYLTPFMEDFSTNIYIDYSSEYKKNTLEVRTTKASTKESDVRNYMSLLKSYTY